MKLIEGKKHARKFCSPLSRLGVGFLSLMMVLSMVGGVQAFQFDLGFANGTLDTTISYGVSSRVAERDNDLIGKSNLPLGQGAKTHPFTDDGNLNYDKGIFSNVLKVTSELDLHRETFGVFLRGSAFYDLENERDDREHAELTDDALDLVGSNASMLDYFLWASIDLGPVPVQVRVGDQVISWGESTFIQNSINAINPINVAAIRLPGAELREALIPEGMVWASAGLTDNLTIEALYLYDWGETIIDPMGSYFSTNDYASEGAEYLTLNFEDVWQTQIPRLANNEASKDGQFGVAARLFVEQLNNTEFGFFYLNYHSRLPLISATASVPISVDTGWQPVPFMAGYFNEYPEDIQLFGVSFSTEFAGVALQGEVSHRKDVPLQVDDVELLFAALQVPTSQLYPGPMELGTYIQGYRLLDVTQVQMTATQLLGPVLGANTGVALVEVGYTHVHSLPDPDVLAINTPGSEPNSDGTALIEHPADTNSWGYRGVVKLTYLNAIGGIALAPRIAWKHDVTGNSPGPGGNFIEGRKAITLGLGATYQSWQADLGYTNFFGAGDYNAIHDRDFVAFNVKYSF